MRLKKIGILILLLVFLVPNFSKADDNFLDNNAVTNLSDVNAHLVVSEFNTTFSKASLRSFISISVLKYGTFFNTYDIFI